MLNQGLSLTVDILAVGVIETVMVLAIGIIETSGMPAAIVIADVLGKSANIQVTDFENVDAGRISIVLRGSTGAVQAAISTTMRAMQSQSGIAVLGHHLIPCPDASFAPSSLWSSDRGSLFASNSVEWLDD